MTRLFSIALVASLAAAPGCANWPGRTRSTGSVSQSRDERRAAAVEAFEEQRDRAQLEAALDCFGRGDVAGCEARLRSLVARHPQDAEIHARLAELAWACGDHARAEAAYRSAIALAPERADLEHALGMLLFSAGRDADAAPHLARAGELDPACELYRL
jgi:Tfp pilus assembly protein PilF